MILFLALLIMGVLQASILPVGLVAVGVYVASLFDEPRSVMLAALGAGMVYDVASVGRLGMTSFVSLLVWMYAYFLVSQGDSRNLVRDGIFFLPVAVVDAVMAGGGVGRVVWDVVAFVLWYQVVAYRQGLGGDIKVRRSV